jgi:hypothetical protein
MWCVVGYDHLTKSWPIFILASIRTLAASDDEDHNQSCSVKNYFKSALDVVAGGTPPGRRIKPAGYTPKTIGERIVPRWRSHTFTGINAGILSGQGDDKFDLAQRAASYHGDAEIPPGDPTQLPRRRKSREVYAGRK